MGARAVLDKLRTRSVVQGSAMPAFRPRSLSRGGDRTGHSTRVDERSSSRTRLPSIQAADKHMSGWKFVQNRSGFDRVMGFMRRPRSPSGASDCSTDCPSDVDDSCSESEASSPRHAPVSAPDDKRDVIIFDWDDTLFPTSWMRSSACSQGAASGQLEDHARLVERTLRAAHEVAKVAIVTLAKRGWITNMAREFLPGLDIGALFVELDVDVFYAREEDCPGAFAAKQWEKLKRSAMRRVLLDFSKRNGGCCSALSIGDDTIERDALKGLIAERRTFSEFLEQPLCKTLKLMDRPTLSELSDELRRLSPLLGSLSSQRNVIDARIDSPVDLNATWLSL